MSQQSPIIVNLFAGPGAGKSTMAAGIFFELKTLGVNCELVREYAKRKVWEGNSTVFENQAYIFGKQFYETYYTAKGVDVVITDSPILLSALYNSSETLGEDFNAIVKKVYDSFNNMHYYVDRVKPYNPAGRHQDESGAIEMDSKARTLLKKYNIEYVEVPGSRFGMYKVVNDVLTALGKPELHHYRMFDIHGNDIGFRVDYKELVTGKDDE